MKRSAYPAIVDLPKLGEGGELASGDQPQERRGAGDQVLPQPRRGRPDYRGIQMKQKHILHLYQRIAFGIDVKTLEDLK